MASWPSVVTLGEVLIDFVPLKPGLPIQLAEAFHRAPGGAPANVAVALSRLGTAVGFIGKVGGDPFGHFLRQTLEDERVDVRALVLAADAQTPLAFVGSESGSSRHFVFYHRGMADTLLRPEEIDNDLIANAEIFHFGSVTLAAEPSRTSTLAAARCAHQHERLVSFDPNVRLEVWGSSAEARTNILDALAIVDVLKVSVEEAQFLTGSNDLAQACRRLREYGPSLVVVTLGGDGCYFETRAASGYVAAPRVATVDTLGAGDAFVAGLLASICAHSSDDGLLHDRQTLEAALRFANAVGAITTTRFGAIPALPTRTEVESLLKSYTGP